ILDADFGATIAGCLPFRDWGWLRQLVHAFAEEDAKQRGSDALAHRPAFERSVEPHAITVALGDETTFPCDHEGRSQRLGRLESRFNGSLEFSRVDLGRQRFVRQRIAHRPRLSARIGQLGLHGYWREMDRALTEWERHAALAAKIFG